MPPFSGDRGAVRCNDRLGSPLRAFLQNAPEFCSQDGRTITGQLEPTVHEPAGCFKVAKAGRCTGEVESRSGFRGARTELPQQFVWRIGRQGVPKRLSVPEEHGLRCGDLGLQRGKQLVGHLPRPLVSDSPSQNTLVFFQLCEIGISFSRNEEGRSSQIDIEVISPSAALEIDDEDEVTFLLPVVLTRTSEAERT